MADLLGSILGSMEKPPSMGEQERKKAKAQKALIEKQQEMEKSKLDKFRQQIQKRVHEFIKDGTTQKLKLEAMDKVLRAIVHDVAEVAGLTSFSFGLEEEDRYVMLWKKEFAPCDEELLAYRKGEEWDPDKAKELSRLREEEEQADNARRALLEKDCPSTNYRDKYKHLIGDEAAKDAARQIKSNSSYGIVPSTNKRDLRTIEQVMADSKARKKQKIELPPDSEEQNEATSEASSSHAPSLSSSSHIKAANSASDEPHSVS